MSQILPQDPELAYHYIKSKPVVSLDPGIILYRGVSLSRDKSLYGSKSFRWFHKVTIAHAYALERILENYTDVYVQCVQCFKSRLFPLIDYNALMRLKQQIDRDKFRYIAAITKLNIDKSIHGVSDHDLVDNSYYIETPGGRTYVGQIKEKSYNSDPIGSKVATFRNKDNNHLDRISFKSLDMSAASIIIGANYTGWYSTSLPKTGYTFPAEVMLDLNSSLRSIYIKVTSNMTPNEIRLIAENGFSANLYDHYIYITPNKEEYAIIRQKAAKMKQVELVTFPKCLQWR